MALLRAFHLLLQDLASTFIFLAVVLASGNVAAAIVAGMLFGAAQIIFELVRKRDVSSMQWLSLALVVGLGSASLVLHDPRFAMVKASLVYTIVGVSMLKRGWMDRYLPPAALEILPHAVVIFGYLWAGLMFFSAALNVILAFRLDVAAWAAFMTIYGIVSKVAMVFIQYAVMRSAARLRRRGCGLNPPPAANHPPSVCRTVRGSNPLQPASRQAGTIGAEAPLIALGVEDAPAYLIHTRLDGSRICSVPRTSKFYTWRRI